MPDHSQPQESAWHTLVGFIPQAKDLSREQRVKMTGLMRQALFLQEKEKKEAQNVFRPEDTPALQALVESLPCATEEEIARNAAELQLEPDEQEMETANWAFRHQSTEGELLVREQLVPFKLIRLRRDFYLLLSRQAEDVIVRGFQRVFGKPPDAHSGHVLKNEEQVWTGWVWTRGEVQDENSEMLTQIRALWKEPGS